MRFFSRRRSSRSKDPNHNHRVGGGNGAETVASATSGYSRSVSSATTAGRDWICRTCAYRNADSSCRICSICGKNDNDTESNARGKNHHPHHCHPHDESYYCRQEPLTPPIKEQERLSTRTWSCSSDEEDEHHDDENDDIIHNSDDDRVSGHHPLVFDYSAELAQFLQQEEDYNLQDGDDKTPPTVSSTTTQIMKDMRSRTSSSSLSSSCSEWNCSICTFANDKEFLVCDMCGQQQQQCGSTTMADTVSARTVHSKNPSPYFHNLDHDDYRGGGCEQQQQQQPYQQQQQHGKEQRRLDNQQMALLELTKKQREQKDFEELERLRFQEIVQLQEKMLADYSIISENKCNI